MTPVCYQVPTERTSPQWCKAFAAGCGGRISSVFRLEAGPVAMFGSPLLWSLLRHAQTQGREWFYGDHAYYGRKQFYRVTRNRYQHDGIGESNGQRFAGFGRPIQPWRKHGTHVLICPQSDNHFRQFGLTQAGWLADVTAKIRAVTDRPIRTRLKFDRTPIDHDLVDCWAVVTFSSAAALDALIAGVPVFVLAEFAASYRMGCPDLSQIESPIRPEHRDSFLAVLADQQWTLEEMSRGMAWETLRVH